jgi:hypothetical protein
MTNPRYDVLAVGLATRKVRVLWMLLPPAPDKE